VERELPGHLVARLVEAGEHAPREDRFELRVDVPLVAFFDAEGADQLAVAQLAAVFQAQGGPAGLQRRVALQADELRAARQYARHRVANPRRFDLQEARIQPDDGHGALNFDLDLDRAAVR